MEHLLLKAMLLALALQTTPLALGMKQNSGGWLQWVNRMLIIALVQAVMLYFGILLGNRFMYLMEDFKRSVLFAAFFLIGIRFFLEVFKIRKGERTFTVTSDGQIIVPSVAASVNTFLSGILLYYIDFSPNKTVAGLFLSSLVFALLFSLLPVNKRSYSIISPLYFLSGSVFIAISVFFAFF